MIEACIACNALVVVADPCYLRCRTRRHGTIAT